MSRKATNPEKNAAKKPKQEPRARALTPKQQQREAKNTNLNNRDRWRRQLVWNQGALGSRECLAVLMALHEYLDYDDLTGYASLNDLARDAKVVRSTVQNALDEGVAQGLITRLAVGGALNGANVATIYRGLFLPEPSEREVAEAVEQERAYTEQVDADLSRLAGPRDEDCAGSRLSKCDESEQQDADHAELRRQLNEGLLTTPVTDGPYAGMTLREVGECDADYAEQWMNTHDDDIDAHISQYLAEVG